MSRSSLARPSSSAVVAMLAVASAAVFPGLGCKGAADTDLFGSPGSSARGVDASTTDIPGSGVVVPPGGGTGVADSGLGAVPADDAGNATAPEDGGTAVDSGTGPVDAGPPPVDASTSGTAAISCGTTTCIAADQECCRTGSGFTISFACVAHGACSGPHALPIPCDDSSDCAAIGTPGVCCASPTSGTVQQVSCRTAGECAQAQGTILCSASGSAAAECPNSSSASPSCTLNPSPTFAYHVCSP